MQNIHEQLGIEILQNSTKVLFNNKPPKISISAENNILTTSLGNSILTPPNDNSNVISVNNIFFTELFSKK